MKSRSLVKLFTLFNIFLLISCNTMLSYPTATTDQLVQPTISVSETSSISIKLTPQNRHKWITRWLSGTVCEPPCWEGIIPGQTPLIEAVSILEDVPDLIITARREGVVSWEIDQSEYGQTYSADGTDKASLIVIDISNGQNVVLREVVDAFGFPSHVQNLMCIHNMCEINLIYSENGMVVKLFLEIKLAGYVEVSENSAIVGVIFFPQTWTII